MPIQILKPKQILEIFTSPNALFPNNILYPVLIYTQAISTCNLALNELKDYLLKHTWGNFWVDGIYKFHHYHSNTHELLIILKGKCKLQIGGPKNTIYKLSQGDLILIPAGIAHRKITSSKDFLCLGAYPNAISYDMKYGSEKEHSVSTRKISTVKLPLADPLYGSAGPLFDYWKCK